ncbi:MAG: hypothetical protein KC656_15705, partial [Myxococcales bacterium]|nr:hypothetical protein [Myxococcales bacterium]
SGGYLVASGPQTPAPAGTAPAPVVAPPAPAEPLAELGWGEETLPERAEVRGGSVAPASTAPRPRPEPVVKEAPDPEPSGLAVVTLEVRPSSGTIEFGDEIGRGRLRVEVPRGLYQLQFTDGPRAFQKSVNVMADLFVCYDLDVREPCK